MKTPILLSLFVAACEPVNDPTITLMPDASVFDIVSGAAYELNAQARCDVVGVSAATGMPVVVDPKWINAVTFPGRRSCFGGMVDGQTVRMLAIGEDGSEDHITATQWESGLYHQLGHILGLDHEPSGIMNYATNGDGLTGEAARKSLLDSLNARGLYPCFLQVRQ